MALGGPTNGQLAAPYIKTTALPAIERAFAGTYYSKMRSVSPTYFARAEMIYMHLIQIFGKWPE